jgi:type I restriction enzyme, S subunit
MSEWIEKPLEDLVITPITYGVVKPGPEKENGVQFVRGGDISNGKISISKLRTISDEVSRQYDRTLLYGNELLISLVGNPGQVAIAPVELKGANIARQVGLIRLSEQVSTQFVQYFLMSSIGKGRLFKKTGGSVQQVINLNALRTLEITLPSLPEQRAIADVLSALDDKIDLLHHQNETLEALAQTLFRQWFVDEAEDNWEEKALDEIANFLNGLACQKHPPKNEVEKLPVLKIKELRGGISDTSDWASTDISDDYIVHNGDVIFSWSGSLLVKIWNGDDCILNQHLFKVTSSQYPKWFYYFWTKFHLQKFIMIAQSKSTTMGHIKRSDISNSEVFVPSIKELDALDEVINPIFDKIKVNGQQIRTLESLRDLLLLKLMSGDVRVKIEM